MKRLQEALGILSIVLDPPLLALIVVFLLSWGAAWPLLFVWAAALGWMGFTYLYYRQSRQQEFHQVIATAAAGQTPLAKAVQAYLLDRPQSGFADLWLVLPFFFVIPGYFWMWRRRRSYDRGVEDV